MSAHLRQTARRIAPGAARPAWQRLLLVLAVVVLVCAQQAATLHTVGHLADGAASAQAAPLSTAASGSADAPADSAPAERHCDKCFQFAQVAGSSVARLVQFAPTLVAGAPSEAPRQALPLLSLLAPRSRGPPTPL